MKKQLTLASSLLATALISPLAMADQYADQVNKELSEWDEIFHDEGFYETHEDFHDTLHAGKSGHYTLELDGGKTYKIVAVCDQDCGDIDLVAFDPYGNEADSDYADDKIPLLRFDVDRTAEYELRVDMVSCSDNPCYTAIAVYAR